MWLDCDPGEFAGSLAIQHDELTTVYVSTCTARGHPEGHGDARALLLALHHPSLDLLGVSKVGGNAPGAATCANAAQLLVAFGAPESVGLWRGSDDPPIEAPCHGDVANHGEGGLGGVTGL